MSEMQANVRSWVVSVSTDAPKCHHHHHHHHHHHRGLFDRPGCGLTLIINIIITVIVA